MTDKYEDLYENLKKRFTVESDGNDYTLGDYMLMKASKKKNEASLPVIQRSYATKGERAVALFFDYVNNKLTIKKPPVKDKTIKAFPLRTSLSAFLTSAVACSFLLCFCLVGAKIFNFASPTVDQASIVEYAPEIEENALEAYQNI
ncbi:MAG: hypothetical protein IJW66_02330 [Clostridia bacterium]|nr:hypothetical protein [Clostridia bacterium]